MIMTQFFITSVFIVLFCVFFNFAQSTNYDDLESMGLRCPERYKCRGRSNPLPFYERNCECDSACQTYNDCCVDFRKRSSPRTTPATNLMCLQYGQETYSGIYVVSKCSKDWTGAKEVKQYCEGPTDFSDPVSAAPVTTGSVTYKNLHCAQCNNADMNSIKLFTFRLSCEGLQGLSEKQIMDQIFFNKEANAWGANRVDNEGKSSFKACNILFELPSYLEKNVRYCRANIISSCARDWTRPKVKKSCEEYMAVVFTRTHAYRNPHCAICNHVTSSQLSCKPDTSSRKKPLPFSALIDINEKDGRNPSCPAKEIFDPYFKMCRKLSCAMPGHVIKSGKCVPGS